METDLPRVDLHWLKQILPTSSLRMTDNTHRRIVAAQLMKHLVFSVTSDFWGTKEENLWPNAVRQLTETVFVISHRGGRVLQWTFIHFIDFSNQLRNHTITHTDWPYIVNKIVLWPKIVFFKHLKICFQDCPLLIPSWFFPSIGTSFPIPKESNPTAGGSRVLVFFHKQFFL